MQKIIPHLWFNDQAEEAVNLYVSIFKDSRILRTARYPEATAEIAGRPAGSIMTISFMLEGHEFVALNGGPHFKLSESFSLIVNCDTQEELDVLWEKLGEGGEEQQCGWLKDRFGLSWQIVPSIIDEMFSDPDPARTERVMQAILPMKKLDIAELKKAYGG